MTRFFPPLPFCVLVSIGIYESRFCRFLPFPSQPVSSASSWDPFDFSPYANGNQTFFQTVFRLFTSEEPFTRSPTPAISSSTHLPIPLRGTSSRSSTLWHPYCSQRATLYRPRFEVGPYISTSIPSPNTLWTTQSFGPPGNIFIDARWYSGPSSRHIRSRCFGAQSGMVHLYPTFMASSRDAPDLSYIFGILPLFLRLLHRRRRVLVFPFHEIHQATDTLCSLFKRKSNVFSNRITRSFSRNCQKLT